jgi:hypothetical protein
MSEVEQRREQLPDAQLMGPLCSGNVTEATAWMQEVEQRRSSCRDCPQGGRQGIAPSSTPVQGWTVGEPPESRCVVGGQEARRPLYRGGLSLGYFSLRRAPALRPAGQLRCSRRSCGAVATQREVTRSPTASESPAWCCTLPSLGGAQGEWMLAGFPVECPRSGSPMNVNRASGIGKGKLLSTRTPRIRSRPIQSFPIARRAGNPISRVRGRPRANTSRQSPCVIHAASLQCAALMRGGAVWQLVGLITRRSQVQILPPLPGFQRRAATAALLPGKRRMRAHRCLGSKTTVNSGMGLAPIFFWRNLMRIGKSQ